LGAQVPLIIVIQRGHKQYLTSHHRDIGAYPLQEDDYIQQHLLGAAGINGALSHYRQTALGILAARRFIASDTWIDPSINDEKESD
jgi:hypothetical protein